MRMRTRNHGMGLLQDAKFRGWLFETLPIRGVLNCPQEGSGNVMNEWRRMGQVAHGAEDQIHPSDGAHSESKANFVRRPVTLRRRTEGAVLEEIWHCRYPK